METMQPLNGPEEDNGEYDIEASPVESQSGAKKDPIAKVSALIKDIRTAPLPKLITYMRVSRGRVVADPLSHHPRWRAHTLSASRNNPVHLIIMLLLFRSPMSASRRS